MEFAAATAALAAMFSVFSQTKTAFYSFKMPTWKTKPLNLDNEYRWFNLQSVPHKHKDQSEKLLILQPAVIQHLFRFLS